MGKEDIVELVSLVWMLWIKNTLQILFTLKPGSTIKPFNVIAQFIEELFRHAKIATELAISYPLIERTLTLALIVFYVTSMELVNATKPN
jgi:hypothetical protein